MTKIFESDIGKLAVENILKQDELFEDGWSS